MTSTVSQIADSGGAVSETRTISVVIPCLNEQDSIGECVVEARAALAKAGLAGEVIVVDNASDDRSAEFAAAAGGQVVSESRRGYGSAYLAGFAAAHGDYVVMADADRTYDFAEIPRFVGKLDAGADLVMGNRMRNIEPGAMPWLHRYIGNPLLSGLLNVLFRTGVRDAHCGMRAFRRSVLPQLDLRTTGMEFASEMVIRAAQEGLAIDQLDISYHPRGGGESKLLSFRDGWRHLRFLLLHSPTHLFVVPGLAMLTLGVAASVVTLSHVAILGREWQMHTLIAGSLLEIVGIQVIGLGLCAQAYATYFMFESSRWFSTMRARFRLEHGLALGAVIGLIGLVLGVAVVVRWIENGFGALAQEERALVAASLIIIGMQIFFTSFLLSILGLRRTDRR